MSGCAPGPVELGSSAPAAADRAACRAFLDALPTAVADQPERRTSPSDGWGAAWGDPPIVLTCGGPPPAGFDRTASCTTVNGVDWFIPEEQIDAEGPTELTMTTVFREQHVEVRMPADYWPPAATLADLSAAVTATLRPTGSCV